MFDICKVPRVWNYQHPSVNIAHRLLVSQVGLSDGCYLLEAHRAARNYQYRYFPRADVIDLPVCYLSDNTISPTVRVTSPNMFGTMQNGRYLRVFEMYTHEK